MRVGLGPTPMLYFAVKELHADGGVMVTGSHNPPDYNGFKMLLAERPFYGEDIQRLGPISPEGAFASGRGGVDTGGIADRYIARLPPGFRGGRALRVASGAGTGAAGSTPGAPAPPPRSRPSCHAPRGPAPWCRRHRTGCPPAGSSAPAAAAAAATPPCPARIPRRYSPPGGRR